MEVYLARCLLQVAAPPVRDGAVALDGGTIVAAGERAAVLARAGADAERRDLGDVVLLPGLVNAHTHVELSWMGADPPPAGDFVNWVRGLLERRRDEDAGTAARAARRAIEFMVSRGTVAIGDIGNHAWIVPLLARSELRGVAFHELYGFRADAAATLIEQAVERLRALDADPAVASAGERWRVVLTPHAAHTTSCPLLRSLADRAAAAGAPLSIHVAESLDEVALLADGGGGFGELLRRGGMWDDAWLPPSESPVRYLDRLGLLSSRTLAVHCVQLTQSDIACLRSRGVSVVTCPRSNRHVGVRPAPVPELLRAGIPLALGTDSLASAPDLDLFAEMAAVREQHPGLAPATILRMATLHGAAALGLDDRLGSIVPGKLDRLIVVPLAGKDDDPLETILARPGTVQPLERAPYERARS